jgi:hypothetical protein
MCVLYKELCIVFMYVYVGVNGDKNVYLGSLKDRHIHLEKHAYLSFATNQTLLGLSAVGFL